MRRLARWAPVALFVLVAALYLPFTIDDGYISMRYATNWARGDGLVFNPGERVEGFSNFLWVALLAVGAVAGVPVVPLAKGLGLLCGAAVIAILSADRDDDGGRLAAWLCAASGGLAYHAVGGLETGLYALTLLLLARSWQDRPSAARGGLLAALALAAALTRPEAAAVLVGVVAIGGWRWSNRARLALVPSVGVAIGLLLIRHAYYGAWLPNTYLAKPGIASIAALVGGLAYLHTALGEDGRYFEFALAFVWLVRPPYGRGRYFASAGIGLVGVAFAVWTGGDWMARSRYLVPYVPLLAHIAGGSLLSISRRFGARDQGAKLVVGACVVVRAVSALGFAADLRAGGIYDHAHVSTGNVAVGRWLAAHSADDATVLTDEIGAIGLYGDRRVLDFWGLIDPEVAGIYHDLEFNPYASDQPAARRHEAQGRAVTALLARRVDWVVVDYRGPIAAEFKRGWVNPMTMPELAAAIEARGFQPVERFTLDPKLPKSFVLYRSPSAARQP